MDAMSTCLEHNGETDDAGAKKYFTMIEKP
jgi:hypothetical protein